MKKVNAILLLFLFGISSFTIKTHYCYYADTGKRFHGDCAYEVKEAGTKGELAHANFFPKHYICQDILKNTQVQEVKVVTIKNPCKMLSLFRQS